MNTPNPAPNPLLLETVVNTLTELGDTVTKINSVEVPQKYTEQIIKTIAQEVIQQVHNYTPKPLPQPQLIQKLEQSIAARTPEPHRVGFVVVDKETNELDWSNEVYYSAQEAIDDMVSCGNYTDTDPTSGRYWGNIYAIKPVTFA